MSVNKVNSDGSLSRVAGGTLYADAPIGAISPFGGSNVPSGYLLCNGQAVSRTNYAELFAVIGTAFGTGDGSTTFNVPDLRETVPVGSGTRGSGVTAHDLYELGRFKDDQLQSHTHGVNIPASSSIRSSSSSSSVETGGTVLSNVGYARNNIGSQWDLPFSLTVNGTSNTSSGRSGTTTHGKQLGVNYIIKAKQVAVPADFKEAIDDVVDESKPIEVSATLDFNEYGNALVTPPTGYKVISAIMPDHNWAFDVFYDNNRPYVHSRGLTDYSTKITGSATLRLVYIKI